MILSFIKPTEKKKKEKNIPGTSLVAQWVRIRLPVQGIRVRSLVLEDPTCRAEQLSPAPQLLSLRSRAHPPRAGAPQQEKPPQREAHAPNEE